jgi:catechol 2,3-dioxygenase-like lactoylglutathione lyase family enzyme
VPGSPSESPGERQRPARRRVTKALALAPHPTHVLSLDNTASRLPGVKEQWEVAPMLGVRDVLEAVEFFCDKLGVARPDHVFTPGGEPVYAIVTRGGVSVHLQIRRRTVFAGPRQSHEGDAYFFVEDADALRAEFNAKGVRLLRDIRDEHYGLRDFTIETPDGHRLTFGSESKTT